MRRTRSLFIAALLLLGSLPAAADAADYALNRELAQAGRSLKVELARIRTAVGGVNGTVLVLDETPKGLVVIFRGPDALPTSGPLASAVRLDDQAQVTLHINALDRERGHRVGHYQGLVVSLDELHTIRTRPAHVKRTGYGAILRRMWALALDGEDDLERIQAQIQIDMAQLDLPPSFSPSGREHLSSRFVDVVLARGKTPDEHYADLLGRYQQPADLDRATAAALVKVYDEGDWDVAQALRAKDPAGYTRNDLAALGLAPRTRTRRGISRALTGPAAEPVFGFIRPLFKGALSVDDDHRIVTEDGELYRGPIAMTTDGLDLWYSDERGGFFVDPQFNEPYDRGRHGDRRFMLTQRGYTVDWGGDRYEAHKYVIDAQGHRTRYHPTQHGNLAIP